MDSRPEQPEAKDVVAVVEFSPAMRPQAIEMPQNALPVAPEFVEPDTQPPIDNAVPSPEMPELPAVAEPDIPVFHARIFASSVMPVQIVRLPPEEQPLDDEEEIEQAGEDTAVVESAPEIAENPPPAYPRAARRRGYEGLVVLEVDVSDEGRSIDIRVVESSGHDILDQAAVDAVSKWRFSPAKVNGLAVAGNVLVPIRFQLTD